MSHAEIAREDDPPTPPAHRIAGTGYAILALVLLCLANACNLADRMLVGILQEPVRLEFGLSDFQLGLLGGPAFAILYSLLSIPVARIADRSNRIAVVAIALGAWSTFTAICGFAGSYLQLLLARLGVSIGEAGGSPPSLSYLADLFGPARRATAMAVFAIGGPAGVLMATFLGGRIAQDHGWRASFLTFGGLGILLAVVIRVTLRELRAPPPAAAQPSINATLRLLASKRSYVHVCAAGVFGSFALNFLMQYMTSFLMRMHELPISRAALILGLAGGVFGMAGAFSGGYIADIIARRRPGARTLVVSAAFVVAAFGFVIALWSPLTVAVPLLLLSCFSANSYPGVSYAVAGGVAPPALRATSIAIFTLFGNLFGYALGPPLLGALSDLASQWELGRAGYTAAQCTIGSVLPACSDAQARGLRWAMTLGALILLVGSFHFWRASKTLERDLAH